MSEKNYVHPEDDAHVVGVGRSPDGKMVRLTCGVPPVCGCMTPATAREVAAHILAEAALAEQGTPVLQVEEFVIDDSPQPAAT